MTSGVASHCLYALRVFQVFVWGAGTDADLHLQRLSVLCAGQIVSIASHLNVAVPVQLRVLRTSDLRPEGRLPIALEEIELLGSGKPLGMMRLERVVVSLRLRSLRLTGWDLSGMHFDLVARVTPSIPPTRPLQVTRAKPDIQELVRTIVHATLLQTACCRCGLEGSSARCVQGTYCRTHLNLRASDLSCPHPTTTIS